MTGATSPTDPITDDEVVNRRVPPGEVWQKPGPLPTSANMRLGVGEAGLSVSRAAITDPRSLLALAGASVEAGWIVLGARVADLRAFGLRVESKPTDADSGHAELIPEGIDLNRRRVRQDLLALFTIVLPDPAAP